MIENRHIVDQLANVRAEIKRLQLREHELRQQVIDASVVGELEGDEFRAVVKSGRANWIDLVALKRTLGCEAIEPFMRQREFFKVCVQCRFVGVELDEE